MDPKYAILRVEKIKDWSSFTRQLDHAERTGRILPANADKNRQRWNQRLFPEAPGTDHAKERWTARLGKQRVRRNAVLAVEVFMGMSDGTAMPYKKQLEWFKDNRAWLAKIFGEENIIGGSLNLDEKTPHFHGFIIPIDKKGKLNCRHYLGDKGKLRKLQDSYADAMNSHGLQRGIKGSKRKHIPQRTLYEWHNQVQRRVTEIQANMDAQIAGLQQTNTLALHLNPQAAIAKCLEIVENAKKEIGALGDAAKDALLVRRDALEREQLVREKNEALAQASVEKQRADAVLKEHANLVRGMDLAPIASEILAIAPVENAGTYVLEDQSFRLEITGRKFRDAKRPEIKGSGAIDLVCKLTAKNFKEAVEFLLAKCSAPDIIAEQAGQAAEATRQVIEEGKARPSLLTLDDIPPQIWIPRKEAWPTIRERLVSIEHIDPALIDNLHKQNLLWAVNPNTLGVGRTSITDETKNVGATIIRLDDDAQPPRVIVPSQQGFFWLGDNFEKTNRIVAVANPLEAFAYRQVFLQNHQARVNAASPEVAPLENPHILSIDQPFPPTFLLHHIIKHKKQLVMATHIPKHWETIRNQIAAQAGQSEEQLDWLDIEVAELKEKPADYDSARAWSKLYQQRFAELQRERIRKPKSPGDSDS